MKKVNYQNRNYTDGQEYVFNSSIGFAAYAGLSQKVGKHISIVEQITGGLLPVNYTLNQPPVFYNIPHNNFSAKYFNLMAGISYRL